MNRRKRHITTFTVIVIAAICFITAQSFFAKKGIKKRILASGRFHQVAHRGEGSVTIYQLLNGDRVLELADFHTGPGQNLELLLITAPDAFENETVEQSMAYALGEVQTLDSNQSFKIPGDVDLSRVQAVTVWSKQYKVNFTTAPLIKQ
jgi:hypothetical protein